MIKVTWTASTDNIGVTGYKVYRNGSQMGTSVTTEYTDTGVASNTIYSYTVSAYDAVGNNSAQSSPPATAATMSAIGTAAAKQLPDGSIVGLVSKIVTAVFGDHFYVEESDRSMGIRVTPVEMPAGLAAGKTVDVGGTMATNSDGERHIVGASVYLNGTGSVDPLALSNKAIGGGDWLYDPGSGAGQQGLREYRFVKELGQRVIVDVSGLNNIGSLVRSWGKVTYAGTGYYYIDDGSGLDDDSGHIGVKVEATGLTIPPENSYVVVTGISSCYRSAGELYRLVRIPGQDDIAVVP